MERGYILHTYAYRETSLILQAWTEKHGRIGLVAKGARRPKSALRTLLVPFQPLVLSWFGRGELKTLKTAEPASAARWLSGANLFAAFYLNELLLKLTHREDPHEGLFAAYDEAISGLRGLEAEASIEPVLRQFEFRLLRELGYAVELSRDAQGAPIVAERDYWYVVERGPVVASETLAAPVNAVRLSGHALMELERGQYQDPRTVAQSKQLMRLLINHSLGGQELATRALVRDLLRLGEDGR